MLILRIYSIFVMARFLIGLVEQGEDRAVTIASLIIFIPVLITLIYGGVC